MKLGKLALLLSVVPCSVLACVSDPSGEPGPATESSQADVTAARYFDCRGYEDTDQIDPSYRPTSATYQGATRFTGYQEITERWSSGGNAEFIVSREITGGAAQGKIWMRTSASDGGGTTSFSCTSKAEPFAPDTAVRARLLCGLDHIVCDDDNPPGSTCLVDLFVNQTSTSRSTLRKTYSDHFGVHVQERREEVGASGAMTRDARSLSAEWAGHRLDVQYRARVTYVGTFTLPDGRSEQAKCNDLAMVDG